MKNIFDNKDEFILKVVYKMGYFLKEDFKKFNISNKRVGDYIENNYLIVNKNIYINGIQRTLYSISNKTKAYLGIDNSNISIKSNSIRHDIAIKDYMLNKTIDEIDSFITEKEISLKYKDKIEDILNNKDELKRKRIRELEIHLEEKMNNPNCKVREINRIKKRINNYKNFGPEIQSVDGIYKNKAGEIKVIECYTDYYTERQKEAKRNFVKLVLEREVSEIEWIKGYK